MTGGSGARPLCACGTFTPRYLGDKETHRVRGLAKGVRTAAGWGMTDRNPIFLRLNFDGHPRFGPGKAALLEHIRDEGSITRAGKAMGMSYKRAWTLVEEMNGMFVAPLVDSVRGGPDGGGARLTEAGVTVLAAYRGMEQKAAVAGAKEISVMKALLSDMSGKK